MLLDNVESSMNIPYPYYENDIVFMLSEAYKGFNSNPFSPSPKDLPYIVSVYIRMGVGIGIRRGYDS